MTIPETPETRGESYLNAIATGDAGGIPAVPVSRTEAYLNAIATGDASGIPEYPETRIEAYLDAIANGGGGGGGGGSSWELIGSDEFEVSTTSTTQSSVGSVDLNVENLVPGDIIWFQVRDKAGKRNDYFYGTDGAGIVYRANAVVTDCITWRYSSDMYDANVGKYGVYVMNIQDNKANIASKYNSTYSKTIDGTYKVDVYKLTPPFTMFE